MKRILTILFTLLFAVTMCCSTVLAAVSPAGQGEFVPDEIDIDALQEALGLTEQEFLALLEGTLDFNDVDLNDVDLGAVVEAMGLTEDQAIELIEHTLNLGDINLSGIELSEIHLGDLVKAIGLTGDDLNKIARGQLNPEDLDFSNIDPKAVSDALGLSEDELVDIVMSAAGAGDFDWRGLLRNAGRGALIGFGAGILVVVLIIVLLSVSGQKKRQAGIGNCENL